MAQRPFKIHQGPGGLTGVAARLQRAATGFNNEANFAWQKERAGLTGGVEGNVVAAPNPLVAPVSSIAGFQDEEPPHIDVAWTDPNSDETGYEVWREFTPGGEGFELIATEGAGVTSYHDINVQTGNGFTYRYQVRAIRNLEEGPFSNISEHTIP